MSDRKDDDKGREKERQYSVDEILEEYGSRPKVVDFPPPEKRPRTEQGKTPSPRPPGQNTIQFPALKEGQEPKAPVKAATAAKPRPQESAKSAQPPQEGRRAQEPPKGQGASRPRQPMDRPPTPKPREPVPPKREEPKDERMVDISPDGPLRRIAAWLSVFDRRTDHYADHMYDQAEPDEATRKAEKYIPGVDREEAPDGRRAAPKRRRRPLPPDVEPAVLSKRYAKGLKSKKIRMFFAAVFAALCVVCSLFDLEALGVASLVPEGLTAGEFRLLLLLGLMGAAGLLCGEVLFRGLFLLFTLRPGPETVLTMAFLATLGDGLYLLLEGGRDGLPCCAVVALGTVFGLWGSRARRQGDRLSARSAAQTKAPFVVTLDEGKWSGRPAYAKWIGTQDGFGSQLQAEDGVHLAYTVAAPLLIVGCLVCAWMSNAEGGTARALWTLSSTLAAAAAWAAPLVFALPYQKLARRLFDMGAALAGWPGISRCRSTGILMSDNDLFPTGTVQVSGIRVFGDFSNEKVVSYTATLLRVLDCGLTQPFRDLVHAQGTFYREVSGVRFHEGGVTGIIRDHEVFVGTADFMHLMDVTLPQGLGVKHAVFCAINGELAGIFAIKYALGQTVRPCLSALMEAGAHPIVATRDPNLIPNFLGEKFKLPVDKMEFPPVERRLQLSDPAQDHDGTPVALLSREGLAPYCDAVVGGKRLRSAVFLGVAFSLIGSVSGIAVTFYLTYLGAVASLTASSFLLFMAFWLVPAVLVDLWVDRF